MKNHKQTWFVFGLFILASVLSIISYLIMTQFVAFLLQVAGLLAQGSVVTVVDVFGAMWQTFGVKLFLPVVTLGAWYVIAELFTTAAISKVKKHGLYLGGTTIVLSSVMLGLTWETFADVPMIVVLVFPAILVTIFASLGQATEVEEKLEISETEGAEGEVTVARTSVELAKTTSVSQASKRISRRKTKKRQRRHLYHTA
ncbi:MAG: hypothetical protein ACRC1D_06280 [Culicoidibacterales bacterium]